MDERLLWLWLASGLGFAPRALHPLLSAYGDAAGVYGRRAQLLREGLVTPGQQRALASSHAEDFEERLRVHRQAGYQVLCYGDEAYPALLREIDDPPAVLYLQGETRFLSEGLLIGMVGTRRPSAYGMEAARFLGKGLAEAGVRLVSGLADGLDSEAHKAAVAAGVPTVAVLGTAVDRTYPARNGTLRALIAKNGAVVSEYPMGTAGQGHYFLLRNRLIAGLSRGLVVTEARRRSGTMSTVRYALDGGRDVFAVPGSIFSPLSEGTNWLLQQGAKPVLAARDVLEEYGLGPDAEAEGAGAERAGRTADAQAGAGLSPEAAALCAALSARPQGLAELCAASGLAPGAAMAALTELELAGLSRQLAGRQFVRGQ